ncbi:MAG: diguanylate cyclase [Vicinamibacteria bacterium]
MACSIATAADRPPTPIDVASQSAPTFTVYTSQHGLSNETWNTVGFDARGFVWGGSASSLARFDGYRWTPWPFARAHSLVRDMEDDGRGNLWAIFDTEGVARYDGRAWSMVDTRPVFHQRFSATPGPNGGRQLWFADAQGFLRQQGDAWVEDKGNPSAPAGRAIALEQTETLFGEPRQWMVVGGEGLWYRPLNKSGSPAPWTRFTAPGFEALPATDLRRSVAHGQEELWVLSYNEGLRRIRNDGVRVWRAENGELPGEALYSALATYTKSGERLLWISSRAGLLRIRGDDVTVFDRRHGLPSNAVRGLKIKREADGTEMMWLATEGGMARAPLEESAWQTVSLLGARENGTIGILIEPDGLGGEQLWVGSSKQGLGLLRRGVWRYFTKANGTLPREDIRGIWRVAGPDGKPLRLLCLIGGRIMRINDDLSLSPMVVPWKQQVEEAPLYVMSRRVESVQELWIATVRTGIYRLRGGMWTHFDTPDGRPVWTVTALVNQTTGDGRSWIWAASDQGLARFDGTKWEFLPRVPGQPVDGYRSVTLIQDGARTMLWTGSNRHGIERFDVTDPSHPIPVTDKTVPPPPDPTVYSVHADPHSRIYVCTNNGVQQLTPKAGGGYSERVFRRKDGLVNDECNTNSQFVDSLGRYWVGTLGGLSVYDPRIEVAIVPHRSKPLYFTDLLEDGEHHDPLVELSLDLRAGAREVRVDFTLLTGQREDESTYRSQLVGYESEPGPWTHERTRAFTRLAPGRYELKVESRDFSGAAGEEGTLVFTVRPFWWQRVPVRVSFGLLLLLLPLGAVALYNRNLRERQHELERQVESRTTELASANLALTELSYADALTGVANRRRLIEAIDVAISRAVGKALPIGIILVDVDLFKAYNDRFGHLSGDAALRAVATALSSATREQDLVARFGGEEFACLLIDSPPEIVATIAERMRALVEALPPRALGNAHQTLTISAGYVSRVPLRGETAADLLQQADAALYTAKDAGRNCVRAAPATM